MSARLSLAEAKSHLSDGEWRSKTMCLIGPHRVVSRRRDRRTKMATKYVCDHCGYEGSDPDDGPADQILCPMCGETVTPVE